MYNMEHFLRTKKLIEYLESFSLANQLINSIKSEYVTFNYSAIFGSYYLKMEVKNDLSGGMKANIQYSRSMTSTLSSLNSNEKRRKLHKDIKAVIDSGSSSSYDSLKDVMVFIVYSIEDLNVVINMLTEGEE